MGWLQVIRESFVLQFHVTRRSPGHALMMVTAPLQSVIFLSLASYSHRPSAVVNAVLAPGLIGLWIATLGLAGEILTTDRRSGRFQLLIIAPVPLSLVVFGRIMMVMVFGALTFTESWLVAALGFGEVVAVSDPMLFVAAIVATCFAMAGTATLLAAVFVRSRALEVFQNSMNYPFYILGGVMVPIALLPAWVRPVSDVFFLSWSADLLRAAIRGSALNWRLSLVMIVGLGLVALAAGMRLIRGLVDKSRREGTVADA